MAGRTQQKTPRHPQSTRHSGQRARYAATGYVGRLVRTIKEEVNLTEYRDLAEAPRQSGRFLGDVDNRKRIHSVLGHPTPAELKRQWRADPSGLPDTP